VRRIPVGAQEINLDKEYLWIGGINFAYSAINKEVLGFKLKVVSKNGN